MKVIGLIVVGAVAACGGNGGRAIYNLAVGWSGSLPTWNGPCDLTSRSGDAVQPRDGGFVAAKPGVTELSCRDGKLRLEVRAPTKLVIDVPILRVGQTAVLGVKAADAEGDLDLGEAPVTWTLPPQLREGDRRSDMIGTSLRPNSVRVTADAPGSFPVQVTLGALTTTVVLSAQ